MAEEIPVEFVHRFERSKADLVRRELMRQTCSWCELRQNVFLHQYGIRPDGGEIIWLKGVFCCDAHAEAFHGQFPRR